jgi:hypothetical protein
VRSCQFSTTTIRHGFAIRRAFSTRTPYASIGTAAAWLAGALLCCLCSPAPVHAYEDQQTLGIGAGYAHAFSDTAPGPGARLELSGGTGLSLAWTARARLAYALHPDRDPLHVGLAALDLLYIIDVLEFVPYFGAGASVFAMARAGAWNAYPAVHAVLGVDYLMSRALTLELDVSAHALITALETDPLYLTATVSLVWMLAP